MTALEQISGSLGARAWQRQNCGTEGVFGTADFTTRAFLIDASRGGFKLRFELAKEATALLSPLPRDILITNASNSTFGATVMWAKDGLAGCRFYQHISLDDVVTLMTAKFKITLARS
ncbi:MAG: PilZ domain-containing protein [Phaeospirillum sp.]|nr:PilZ domain-containing protein [Phaeospirillum sp.]